MDIVPAQPEPAMALRLHLPHRTAASSAHPGEHPGLGARVYTVQRIGAVVVALFLLLFALLGFASGQGFFSTRGQSVLGMSSNGLLSTISVVVAIVLLAAAAHSARTASTVMLVLGPLFLLSALVNSIVIGTQLNLLAFQISNVIFSVVVGLLMLLLGAYGRISSQLPPDSPYAHHPSTDDTDYVDERPSTPEEVAAEEAMREAEIAVVQRYATDDQYRRVEAMAAMHTRVDRRRVWMEFDRSREDGYRQVAPAGHGAAVAHRRTGRHLPWHRAGARRG
jgi:hypothetical protein